MGGGPRLVASPAAFHEFGVRYPVSAVWKKQKMFLPHPRVKASIVGSLRNREVACSASDRQGSNFESCVWRTVSSHSSHHPQEVLLAQFSLYVHKIGLKPDSFHFQPLGCKMGIYNAALKASLCLLAFFERSIVVITQLLLYYGKPDLRHKIHLWPWVFKRSSLTLPCMHVKISL